jgi:hypothetical protein
MTVKSAKGMICTAVQMLALRQHLGLMWKKQELWEPAREGARSVAITGG